MDPKPKEDASDNIVVNKDVLSSIVKDALAGMVSQTVKEGMAGEKTTKSTVESDLSDIGNAEAMQAAVVKGNDAASILQLMILSGDYAHNATVRSQAQTVTHMMDLSAAELAKKLGVSMIDHADLSFDKTLNLPENEILLNRILKTENVGDAIQVAMGNFVNAIWEKILEVKEEN